MIAKMLCVVIPPPPTTAVEQSIFGDTGHNVSLPSLPFTEADKLNFEGIEVNCVAAVLNEDVFVSNAFGIFVVISLVTEPAVVSNIAVIFETVKSEPPAFL